MAWYYHLNGENQGPVEASALRDLKARGAITLDTPVWTPGLAGWTAYGRSSASAPVVAPPFVPGQTAPPPGLPYAPVGLRLLAFLIDAFGLFAFLMVFLIPLSFLVVLSRGGGKPENIPPWLVLVYLGVLLSMVIVPVIYEMVFDGKYGATLGKMAMGLQVVQADGRRLSFLQATGRALAKLLTRMTFGIGYLVAFFDAPQGRALHDHICDTRVVVRTGWEAGAG